MKTKMISITIPEKVHRHINYLVKKELTQVLTLLPRSLKDYQDDVDFVTEILAHLNKGEQNGKSKKNTSCKLRNPLCGHNQAT